MPVFTLHNFNDAGTTATDSAVENGAQNGLYLNGAAASGGQAVLDGVDDIIKIYPNPTFQMDRGTLNIQFTLADNPLTGPQTVLSRDSAGPTDGGYHIDIGADGSVVVSHETPTGTQTFGTAPGFAAPGDTVNLTYSWDQGGTGGSLQIDNQTTGGAFDQPVPNSLTMDQGGINQPWIIGAGQSTSDPAMLNNIDQHFAGTVAVFSLSDTVDNTPNGDSPDAQPDTATTSRGDPVVIPVLENDTDPNGDPLTVTGGSAPNGLVTVNPDGTLSYTPNAGFTGTDTITYTITDPSGLTDSSTVTVTVVPDGAGPDGIVRGTTGGDLIDTTYIDPFDTDRVDANDAILPGDAPNDDRILAGSGNDTVLAGLGDDSVDSGGGNDVVSAGQGDDTVFGGAGNNLLNGDDGNDSLVGGAGSDTLNGGLGDDTLQAGGNPGVGDVLNGDAGNDELVGGGAGDTLTGGAGADTLTGNGASVIHGDDATTADLPDLAYPGLYAADADPDNNRDLVQAGPGGTTVYGGDDADTVYGGMAGDTLYGGVDSDSLFGYEGNDLILGGEGLDTLLGGDGDDTIQGEGAGTVAPDLADTDGDLVATNNRDDIAGGAGNDVLYGGDDQDRLHGDAGNDQLYGGNDDDILAGDAGNDLIDGGQGADALTGNADRDTFINVTAGDRVDGSGTGDDYDTLDLRGLGPLRVDYDPANAENGTVTFLDGTGAPTGTMTFVEIENVLRDPNLPPTAGPDVAETPEDTAVTIPVLGNDADPDGQPLTVTTATALNGTVVINPNGSLTYMPNPDYNGPDTITYTVTDPDGNTDTTTVAMTVTPANDAPVAADDGSTTSFNTPVTFAVLGNDTDVDGDTLTIQGTPTSADGTVTVNPDGTLTFMPNPGFTGSAAIAYTVVDAEGLTDTAVWTVNVGTTPPPTRDGYVRGTEGGDLIDSTYVDPFDADRVDSNDAILPGDAPNDDRILAGAGNDTVRSGTGSDSVEGGAGNDILVGAGGHDTLLGQTGDDILVGQTGNDSIIGGDGNDSVRGGTGDDVIDTSGGGAAPLPDQDYPGLYPADTDPANDLDTVYGGTGNDSITTGDDADFVSGGWGNDRLDGGFDNDTLDGNQGNDSIIGAEGADLIDGGYGDDLVYGGYGPGVPDAVNIRDDQGDLRPQNGNDSIRGGIGNDTIFGMDDDDTIDGGQDNDLIDGGIDEDLITGGTGNDTIIGGQGVDTLSGGNDRDTFLIGTPTDGLGDVINGNEGGDDFDTLDLRGSGPFRINYAADNPENGTVDYLDPDGNVTGTLTFTNIENVIPCFTPGTLIATPKGEVLVEDLKVGDRIITRDNGIQEIRWTGTKALGYRDLFNNPHLKPVLVRQGSLGNGLPERDMTVSPNHRLLVANDRTALYFDEHEVLVAAKHLVAAKGVSAIDSVGTTYIHFMFDRHEVVLSNGAWTESFQPGDYTLKGMGNAQRSEIFDLFPELKTTAGLEGYQAARRTLKRHEALLLVK